MEIPTSEIFVILHGDKSLATKTIFTNERDATTKCKFLTERDKKLRGISYSVASLDAAICDIRSHTAKRMESMYRNTK